MTDVHILMPSKSFLFIFSSESNCFYQNLDQKSNWIQQTLASHSQEAQPVIIYTFIHIYSFFVIATFEVVYMNTNYKLS